MAIFEWRKFNFFDLRANADGGAVAVALGDAHISSTAFGNGQIIVGDSSGLVHIFARGWVHSSFKAHEDAVLLCELACLSNLLVTIGIEESGASPVLKVWKVTPTNSLCVRTVRTALQRPTALGIAENGQFMAIGFSSGGISLYRGDITRDKSSKTGVKQLSGGNSPIKGIVFRVINTRITHMFVCSDNGVTVHVLHSRSERDTKSTLDDKSTLENPIARCCAMQLKASNAEAHFMVGRDDAIYCYTADGRGPCYALEGEKSIVQWFRSNLLVISKQPQPQGDQLTVIDIQNKFIVFMAPMPDDEVSAICVEFGSCFIISKESKAVHQLDEKDVHSKLSLLFKKNLFDIAVRLAKSNEYDREGLADIFRHYGDHLYGKGDFSSAIDQYNKTIGYVEPSYVIRKFLDSRHIVHLAEYLQALHTAGQATPDHTSLLLNCFKRLDQPEKLCAFLGSDTHPDIMFDIEVAIQMCRSAALPNALMLATTNKKHDAAVAILMEDMKDYKKAVDYIDKDLASNLPEMEKVLSKYGSILIENHPRETLDLIKRICILGAVPDSYIHLFQRQPSKLVIEFLEHLIREMTECSPAIYNHLIEVYLGANNAGEPVESRLMELLKEGAAHNFDRAHVLALCRTHGFHRGVLMLYEDARLYHLVVRDNLRRGDYQGLLDACQRLGGDEPGLWLQALTGLRNDKNAPAYLLSHVLQVISDQKLQAPLQVLQCLAIENGPNLGAVREYFQLLFQRERDAAQSERVLVQKYQVELNELRDSIYKLKEEPVEIRTTLCDTCNQRMTQPAIYFLCGHSYHQDCVRGYSENERDCPVCHTRNIRLMDALRAQNESRNQHDAFHGLLNRSSEPFSIVAEYFGRGLFNKIVIVEENEEERAVTESPRVRKPAEKKSSPVQKPPAAQSTAKKVQLTNQVKTPSAQRIKSVPSTSKQAKATSSPKASTNPFGEADDDYDDTLNPFAGEADANPGDTYDDNLNPFA